MPETPIFKLPYPDANGHTRTWEHWQGLAQGAEAALAALTSNGQITRLRVGSATGTADSASAAIIPHGLTVVPKAVFVQVRNGGNLTPQLSGVLKPAVGNWDSSNFVLIMYRSDTGALLGGTPYNLYWLALG